MKHLVLKSMKMLAIAAALFGVITLNSCKDDEEVTPGGATVLVEDGFYLQGPSTAYSGFDIKAALTTTRNEVLQEDRAQLLEIFAAVKAGEGFNIVQVAGAERTTWGPGADFAASDARNDEPMGIQRGSIATTDTKFTVSEDGLYHIVIDTETGAGAVVKVDWGVIGAATPGGWSGDTRLTATAFDLNTMTWSVSGAEMSSGEWKFRYSNGWKVELDSTLDVGNDQKGVKFNANFGGTLDALVAGGDNFKLDKSGIYDLSITWTAGAGHSAKLTRTGDLPSRDYSAVIVGLIGDGVKDGNWDGELLATTPTKDGDTYTWTYNGAELLSSGGFKLRTQGTWDDINEGFSDIIGGPDAADIQDNGGNMQAKADGMYDIVFVIDAAAETKSITVTKK